MSKHNEVGEFGEKLAIKFLRNKGYVINETNYRFDKAEIDIIATISDIVVFIEVKTRSTTNNGFPEEAVDHKKQQLITKAAQQYILDYDILNEIRFDIISIAINNKQNEIFHIEDAFFLQE